MKQLLLEYQNLIYSLSDEYYQELKKSIAENGQYHPIIINSEGVVLDGHHRYRICLELNIKPRTEIKKFESDLHEKLFVVGSNLNRRHLNDYQRAKLALWAKPVFQEIARLRMLSGKKQDPPKHWGRVSARLISKSESGLNFPPRL